MHSRASSCPRLPAPETSRGVLLGVCADRARTNVCPAKPLVLSVLAAAHGRVRAVLDALAANASNLKSLELSGEHDFLEEPEVLSLLSKTVCCLNNFVTLDFGPMVLTSDAINHISSIPGFNSLYLRLTPQNCLAWRSPSWTGFKTLSNLRIHCYEELDDMDRVKSMVTMYTHYPTLP